MKNNHKIKAAVRILQWKNKQDSKICGVALVDYENFRAELDIKSAVALKFS